jgi:hypothetical protein
MVLEDTHNYAVERKKSFVSGRNIPLIAPFSIFPDDCGSEDI